MSKRVRTRIAARQPLLYAALAFSAGILIGVRTWRPPTWWMLTLVTLSGAVLYFGGRRVWLARSLALLIWTAFGALSIQMRHDTPTGDIDQLLDGNEVTIMGHVIRDGKLQQGGFGGMQQSVDIASDTIETALGTNVPSFGIRLNLYAKAPAKGAGASTSVRGMPIYEYGQRIRCRAKLHWPRNYRNPGAFDYVGYLREQGIAVQGSARADSVELLPGFAGSRIQRWRGRIRANILQKVHDLWPAREAALIAAMVIGDDTSVGRDVRADFQRSGTYHILVVSGMNVGILAFVFFWLLRRLRVGDITASVVVVISATAYAAITDVGPPIWRATLMLVLYLGVRLLYRERSMLNAIGGSALGLLIVDPKALLGASFQLTFLAVLIIGGIGVPLLERTSEPYKKGLRELVSSDYDVYLPAHVAQFRLDLRMIAARLARFLGPRIPPSIMTSTLRICFTAYETLLISALMQVGLALPMAWYFHRATVMGLPANVFVIPLTGILMPAAVASVVLSYVSTALASVPAWATAVTLHWITEGIRWVGTLRVADLRIPQPSTASALAACLAVVAAIVLARNRRRLTALALVMLSVSAIWIALVSPTPITKPGLLELTAIDVGQADATLIVTPEGRTLLIDAGGPLGGVQSEFDTGEDVVSPYLWARGFKSLDAVAITHAHSDHIGGMRAIVANFRPRELWIGATPSSGPLEALLKQVKEQGTTVIPHVAGERFAFGTLDVQVLWPPRDWPSRPQARNEDSMVMRLAYGGSAVFTEGDADQRIERAFSPSVKPVDILKVGHNGSATSTAPELLSSLKPNWAVISVGAHNSFGHPRREVLERLEENRVTVHRTDMEGAVTIYLNGISNRPVTLR